MPLFTTAEARVWDKQQLADAAKYPDADITAAEARIRARFADICGVQFVAATGATTTLDGTGDDTIYIACANVTAVTAGTIDAVALTAGELLDLAVYPTGKVIRKTLGIWTAGHRNVVLTYSHGLAAVPADIKRVALMVAARELVPSNIPMEATSISDGQINWSRIVDASRGRWYGIPEVDGVLNHYRDRYFVPGLA